MASRALATTRAAIAPRAHTMSSESFRRNGCGPRALRDRRSSRFALIRSETTQPACQCQARRMSAGPCDPHSRLPGSRDPQCPLRLEAPSSAIIKCGVGIRRTNRRDLAGAAGKGEFLRQTLREIGAGHLGGWGSVPDRR